MMAIIVYYFIINPLWKESMFGRRLFTLLTVDSTVDSTSSLLYLKANSDSDIVLKIVEGR